MEMRREGLGKGGHTHNERLPPPLPFSLSLPPSASSRGCGRGSRKPPPGPALPASRPALTKTAHPPGGKGVLKIGPAAPRPHRGCPDPTEVASGRPCPHGARGGNFQGPAAPPQFCATPPPPSQFCPSDFALNPP